MATKRFADNAALAVLADTDCLVGFSPAGGAADPSGTVAPDDDIQVPLPTLLAYLQAKLAGLEIITEASAFTAEPASHAGLRRYVRAGGDVTFDVAEAYESGQTFNLRATGAIELVEDGVTLIPPAGGTLAMTAGMSVTVVMVDDETGDVIGQTVPA